MRTLTEPPKISGRQFTLFVALLVAATWAFAETDFVYLADSEETDLTQPSAWSSGVVPGPNDVAVFDGIVPATLFLGSNTWWARVSCART